MPDIFLVEARERRDFIRGADVRSVPLRNHRLPIRVEGRPEHEDYVVENSGNLRVVTTRQKIVGKLNRVLRASDFGRVHRAVDMNDRFPLPDERTGVVIREPFGMRESQGDFAIALDIAKILRRGNEHYIEGLSLGRLAHFDELELVASSIELPKIVDRVVIGGEVKIRPNGEAERRFRRRNRLRGNDGRRKQKQEQRSHIQSFHEAGILSDRRPVALRQLFSQESCRPARSR